MTELVDYDRYHYDYSEFWKDRKYEDAAERMALRTLLKNREFNNFIDIGGSYGRLTDLYYKSCKNVYIIDYSLETLIRNYKRLKKAYPNVFLISANAYNLPFKNDSFDGGMMIRVLHHIDNQSRVFDETYRTSCAENLFIFEYANKRNIKSLLKGYKYFKKAFFDLMPLQQPNQGNNEGTQGESVVFLNYHPLYVKQRLFSSRILKLRQLSVSYLRSTPLARLPLKISLLIEKFLQTFFSWSKLSPSIFIATTKMADVDTTGKTESFSSLDYQNSIICCPKCHSDLNIVDPDVTCTGCEMKFSIKSGVLDLRYSDET